MKDPMIKYIHTAIDIEKKGLEFYRKAIKKVNDPNSDGLLRLLVEEETAHLKFFRKMLKDPEYRDHGEVKKLKSPLFKKTAYKKIGNRKAQIINIFTTALEMEEIGIKFYRGLSNKVKDKKLSKFLLGLSEMEKRHFDLIRQHQDSVYDQWYWEAMEMPALNT